jgi:pyruvate, water dikinase
MLSIIRNIFSGFKPQAKGPAHADEALRRAFKLRYMQFRRLLNANDKALKTMSEMETVLSGDKPFGMSFIRSRCALLFVNVYQIIQHLEALSGGRHKELDETFNRLQRAITPFLESAPRTQETALVLDLEHIDKTHAESAGVKMASLGDIARRLNVVVPAGFVISAAAYHRFMTHQRLQEEINQRIQSHEGENLDQLYKLSSVLQQLVMGATVPEDVTEAIQSAVTKMKARTGERLSLAVRSSGVNEDLPGASFAGQYRSLLNVRPDHLIHAYKEVVAGKFGVTAMSYRLHRGLRDEDIVMCVGCLQMVDAVSGGVIYTRNPLDIRDDTIIINSVWGLPKMVVDGRCAVDQFVVSRSRPQVVRARQIGAKKASYRCLDTEGLCRDALTEEQGRCPSLDDRQVLVLARLAADVENYYGKPQDIEWAIDPQGRVTILQCRPLSVAPSPEGSLPLEQSPRSTADSSNYTVLLQGKVTASGGIASGKVRLLKREADMLEFASGDVMVIQQSLPGFAIVLNRAAAVIAEYGSISSHLANVAREYQVPALFGAEGAMNRLQNGQAVIVDADAMKVYEGAVPSLLETTPKPTHIMAGTPVYATLKKVMPYISPLTLLNPEAPTFVPAQCTSLHDIIRYCHEKAVSEMFEFGRKNEFPRRSSKQLFVNVPMQWWILNLDDGFAEEVDSPTVRLENITSIPMRALWEGITREPWQGPPPIDGKGLLSVMFEATRNTALIPSMHSQYAQRNYFMIARNYCSLMSRFGFHFSTVESYVSDRVPENYIIFRFKGGAADDFRKMRRIHLIADILEGAGFAVTVTADALSARFEDYPMHMMQNRLNIIGYLTMHTRQLDMVMSKDAMVGHYRKKMKQDIERLFLQRENDNAVNSGNDPLQAARRFSMPAITISRGSYSRGKEVAEIVARKLGYQCISRDILLEASSEYNIPEIKLVRAIHDAPSIFRGRQAKEKYITYIRAALLEYLRQDNVVYHGLAGHFFVSGISHVLKVRILADIDDRVREEMQREGIHREEALRLIKKDDEHRRSWSRELYGIDTADASLYDLVIHVRNLTTEDAAELIIQTARLPQFTPTAQSRKALDDLALAAKVKAALIDIRFDMEVRADGDAVFIQTEASPAVHGELTEQITAIARTFPEVTHVNVRLSRLTPYSEDGLTIG